MHLKFSEWLPARLSQDQPPSAGNPEETGTNSDRAFGKSGVNSKYMTRTVEKNISQFSPERVYGKKRRGR
jgi:hypothetical protein